MGRQQIENVATFCLSVGTIPLSKGQPGGCVPTLGSLFFKEFISVIESRISQPGIYGQKKFKVKILILKHNGVAEPIMDPFHVNVTRHHRPESDQENQLVEISRHSILKRTFKEFLAKFNI